MTSGAWKKDCAGASTEMPGHLAVTGAGGICASACPATSMLAKSTKQR